MNRTIKLLTFLDTVILLVCTSLALNHAFDWFFLALLSPVLKPGLLLLAILHLVVLGINYARQPSIGSSPAVALIWSCGIVFLITLLLVLGANSSLEQVNVYLPITLSYAPLTLMRFLMISTSVQQDPTVKLLADISRVCIFGMLGGVIWLGFRTAHRRLTS
jgi:uncharacterized membrane protein